MQHWAFDCFDEELGSALVEHLTGRGVGTTEHPANEDDLALSSAWLLLDRPLACGDTPARLYAELSELPPRERWLAGRIAASQLGVHRVIDVEPGAWMDLEDVLTGTRVRVDSPNVSVDAVRWHVLICRVERGGPVPALWGGAAFYEPSEEVEILAELRRIAGANGLGTDAAGLAAALCTAARQMAGFVPPSRLAERTFFTLEGDPVVLAEGSWRLREPAVALRALCGVPELSLHLEGTDGNEHVLDWLVSRRDLIARRAALPPGALVLEGGPVAMDARGELTGGDITCLGTFTVRGELLELSCISAGRLDAAVALVERTLGPLATEPERRLRSIEEAREDEDGGSAAKRSEWAPGQRRAWPADGPEARFQALVYRRWVDDPNPWLGGLSPREAAGRPEHREQLERQLRIFEHSSASNRGGLLAGAEVAWLRQELALDSEPVAR